MRSIELRTSLGLLRMLIFGWVGGLVGCGSVEPVAPHEQPVVDPAQLYMSLTLDHPAATLSTSAPYNTLQLIATPRDALGNPMSGLPAPTFKVLTDTSKVRVTADGLVTAVGVISQVPVLAILTVGLVTHTDTTLIQVTSETNPPVLDTLSIEPLPPDSAVWPMVTPSGSAITVPNVLAFASALGYPDPYPAAKVVPTAVSTAGTAIANTELLFMYTSLDPSIATIAPRSGVVVPLRPGQVRIVAQTMAYGVSKTDTVTFTVTLPGVADFGVFPGGVSAGDLVVGGTGFVAYGGAATVRIAPNGIVVWYNGGPAVTDVTFDDPAEVVTPPTAWCTVYSDVMLLFWGVTPSAASGSFCGTGSVLLPAGPSVPNDLFALFASAQIRQFPVPGTYRFHNAAGAAGKVVVTAELN